MQPEPVQMSATRTVPIRSGGREDLIYEHLGLRSRDEHAGSDLDHDVAEGDLSGHVLQRLAGCRSLRTPSRSALRSSGVRGRSW